MPAGTRKASELMTKPWLEVEREVRRLQSEWLSFNNNQQIPGEESCSDVAAASTYSLLILLSSLHPSVFSTLPSTRTRNDD